MIITTVALADNIVNTVDNTTEKVTIKVGEEATVGFWVEPQNGDGKQGCNLIGQTTLKVGLVNSNPNIATLNPSEITFTSCNPATAPINVTVTAVAPGTTTISMYQIENNTSGSFVFTTATFSVVVTSPNTAPSVVVTGVTNGASYEFGSVPGAGCSFTDVEDGTSTFAAELSAITGEYASYGIGSQTASCSYTDAGGLTATASATYSIVDSTPPILEGMPNDMTVEGNTTGGAYVEWTYPTAIDAVDLNPTVVCAPASDSFFALGGPHVVACKATDFSGNFDSDTFKVTVVDTTAPSISCPVNITGIVGQAVVLGTPTVLDIVDADPDVTNNAPAAFLPGLTTITWTATDQSNNSASCNQTVILTYQWFGFFQPIDNGNLNLVNGGRTIPVKWALKDANDNFVSDLDTFVSLTSRPTNCTPGDPGDPVPVEATGGTVLRYDFTDNQFIYNWATFKSWAGTCRQLTLTLNDGTTHTANFKFK